ncbi:MAG: hypothetical protein J7L14_03830 [Candidatus Diapherotrites archaeon]|nr:hypothetical protein [Candidatus Diapherotrites archaeon]
MSTPVNVQVRRLIDPDTWVKRMLSSLSAVGEANYKDGITHPRKPIIESSVAAEGRYKAVMRKVIEEERRKKGLQGLTDNDVATYAVLFAPRLVEGVKTREPKVRDRIQKWHPILSEIVQKIDQMPNTTDAEREQRMLANLRALKAAKGRVKGG